MTSPLIKSRAAAISPNPEFADNIIISSMSLSSAGVSNIISVSEVASYSVGVKYAPFKNTIIPPSG